MDYNYKDEFESLNDFESAKGKRSYSRKTNFKEIVKARAYEILSINFNKTLCIKQLTQEFNVSERTVYTYFSEVEEEIKNDNKERKDYIKINCLNKLFEISSNSKNNFEVIKAIETIIKLTGISEEVIKTENLNTDRKFIIELEEEKEKDDDGNE